MSYASDQQRAGSSSWEGVAILVALAFVAVIGAGVWLAGQLAGLLEHGRWPAQPFTVVLGVKMIGTRVNHQPLAAAWLPAARPQLGPPWLLWTIFGLMLLLVVVLVTVVASWWMNRRTRKGSKRDARYAARADLGTIRVPADPAERPGRLPLAFMMTGRNGQLLAAERCYSTIVIGPPGSAKTQGVLLPAVIEWHGPVVTCTVKPWDLNGAIAARRRIGPVWVFDPAGVAPGMGSAWNPIDLANTWDGAGQVSDWIVSAGHGTAGHGNEDGRTWELQARRWLRCLAYAAWLSGGGMKAFIDWAEQGDGASAAVRLVLDVPANPEAKAALQTFSSIMMLHDAGRSSIYLSASAIVDAYSSPAALASAARTDFTVERLLAENGTLVLTAPEADQDRYAPLLTVLARAVVVGAQDRAAKRQGPLDPELLLALDEASSMFDYPRLPELAMTGRGAGIQLLLAFQDMAGMVRKYGTEGAWSLFNNARARLLLSGCNDEKTLDYLSRLLGDERISRESTTRSYGTPSVTTSDTTERMAPASLLRQISPGEGLLLYGHLPPAWVKLRLAYNDPELLRAQQHAEIAA